MLVEHVQALKVSIRQQAHMNEHSSPTGFANIGTGQSLFMQEDHGNDGAYVALDGDDWYDQEAGSYQATGQSMGDSCAGCEWCRQIAYNAFEAGFDTDTDSEIDMNDAYYDQLVADHSEAEVQDFLHETYLMAKRRWRRFSQREPRRHRTWRRRGK